MSYVNVIQIIQHKTCWNSVLWNKSVKWVDTMSQKRKKFSGRQYESLWVTNYSIFYHLISHSFNSKPAKYSRISFTTLQNPKTQVKVWRILLQGAAAHFARKKLVVDRGKWRLLDTVLQVHVSTMRWWNPC